MPISDEGREALRDEGLRRYEPDTQAEYPINDNTFFDVPVLGREEPEVVGEDPRREGIMNDLVSTPSRPLTDDEEDAARLDAERTERVYAPASARVPKEPAPGDDRIIRDG
jgi:hypothetical protein